MLVFLLKAKAQYTIASYLEHWAPNLRSEVTAQTYESLGVSGALPAATYVFCDHERWSQRELALAEELWRQLAAAGKSHVVVNDPTRVLGRHALLKTLHDRGGNLFAVHRPVVALFRTRFPAFLHSTDNHEGALSPLVTSRAQLLRWIARRARPRRWRRLLVEEFCDVSSNGLFAKYSAFNMAGRIVPRHLFVGRQWCLKDSEIVDGEAMDLFDSFLSNNPHAAQLAEIFQLSGIDYGRIDYGIKDGKIQTWEINTNPMLIGFPPTMPAAEAKLTGRFKEMIQPHLHRLSNLHEAGTPLPYRLSREFRR